jgi:hypothetical protein
MPAARVAATRTIIFNNRLDALVAALFLGLVAAILMVSMREWALLLARRKPKVLREAQAPRLLESVIDSESRRPWWRLGTLVVILGALARELSGEAAAARSSLPPDQALAQVLAKRYDNPHGPGGCC